MRLDNHRDFQRWETEMLGHQADVLAELVDVIESPERPRHRENDLREAKMALGFFAPCAWWTFPESDP